MGHPLKIRGLPAGTTPEALRAFLRAERAQTEGALRTAKREAAAAATKVERLDGRLREIEDGLRILD